MVVVVVVGLVMSTMSSDDSDDQEKNTTKHLPVFYIRFRFVLFVYIYL